jgi:glycosyltransferase involved in cell wall biosynthesis
MPVKISVVIPTYRRSALLARCLEALSNQSFDKSEYEVIVVSDGPDESTAKIVTEFFIADKLDVRYFFLDKKKGPAAARNLGWLRAEGSLIAFTDDDCLPASSWLSHLWKAYNGETLIAFSGKVKVPIPGKPTDYEKNTANLETASFITANCCCTKMALEQTGGFDERFLMAWREDSDLEFKLMLRHIPVMKLDDALVIHPVRKAQWGVSIREQKKGMFNALLYKKFPQLYRQKIQRLPAWDYYLIVLLMISFVAGVFINKIMMGISLLLCGILFTRLIIKRLSATSLAFNHVLEVIATSLVIPFLSVYWQLYGAWRYRVLFL